MNYYTKHYTLPLIILFLLTIILIFLAIKMTTTSDKQQTHRLSRVIQIAEEYGYFQGQKNAINGDIRIKYDESTKKYSWSKSCWDGETLSPIFDPFKSENFNSFLNITNLTK